MSISSKTNHNSKIYRIVFLGDPGVGKTSIIQRYTNDRFDQGCNSTVGIDFNVKDLIHNGIHYRLQLWDTAGQQRYRSLIPTYLKNADCVLLIFDITKQHTFKNLDQWYRLFKQHQQAPGIIVANKTDLKNTTNSSLNSINKSQIQLFCLNKSLKYIEVSAKFNHKITQLFSIVMDIILHQQQNNAIFDIKSSTGYSTNNVLAINSISSHNGSFNHHHTNIVIIQNQNREKVKGKCCYN